MMENDQIEVETFLALGSNLGDRVANLQAACQAMSPVVQILQFSPIYETPPWGILDQPHFLNQVVRGKTGLAPLALLAFLKDLETRLGRQAGARYGPRVIDLDILFYEDQVLAVPGLTIPHPRLTERAFVLVPLASLASEKRHPLTGKRMIDHLCQVDSSDIHLFDSNT